MPTLLAERQHGAEQTVALVYGGLSLTKASEQIAAEYGVTSGTVRRWVDKSGLKVVRKRTNFEDFNAERRAKAGNRLAAVIEGRLGQLEMDLALGIRLESRDIRELAVAFGIATDKRRLEDGLSTDRIETEEVPAREIIADKIDELADRRAKRDN